MHSTKHHQDKAAADILLASIAPPCYNKILMSRKYEFHETRINFALHGWDEVLTGWLGLLQCLIDCSIS
jgi:hypothetical protein